MRIVSQRVTEASVTIEGKVASSIGKGVLIFLGIEHNDTSDDAEWLAKKIADMRIFEDDQGKMNRSIKEVAGSALVVSQFTLHASTKKGNRPSFIRSADPQHAIPLYEEFINKLQNLLDESNVQSGHFGANMQVNLCNDGPVTILMDSKNRE